jgi:hypothetical protein
MDIFGQHENDEIIGLIGAGPIRSTIVFIGNGEKT